MNLNSALTQLHSYANELGVLGFVFDKSRFEVVEILLKNDISIDLDILKWFNTNSMLYKVKQIPNHQLELIITYLEKKPRKDIVYYSLCISDWISIFKLEKESRKLKENYEKTLLSFAEASLEIKLLRTFIEELSENSVNLRMELLDRLMSAELRCNIAKMQLQLV